MPVPRASLNGAVVHGGIEDDDLPFLLRAAAQADSSAGLTQPHPNAGCVLIGPDGQVLAETFQRAQGTESAEVQALQQAGPSAQDATAYLNLETGDCHGDDTSVAALVQSGVRRVVVGIRHPLAHLRGNAVRALRSAGVSVDVLEDAGSSADPERVAECLHACLQVNEALLHRAVTGRPFSILKYAMTADGKIATSTGHSAWVSSPASRQLVFETRARSDAVIVGGNTVRRDNPRLTTRREGGHTPVRIVMSRTLDLPEDANLWDVSSAPTIVMTQRGARKDFQELLRSRGVEVVQFDFLTPEAVAAYCQERGFLQVLWECGGTLAAPAIAAGVVHKALAFIAPKLIGGVRAPSPVGELGNVEMTQAVSLAETSWQVVGPDMLLTGYLPSSGGLASLEAKLKAGAQQLGTLDTGRASGLGSMSAAASSAQNGAYSNGAVQRRWLRCTEGKVAEFYKSWDRYGALSNFSAHPISMPSGPVSASGTLPDGPIREWPSLEHFYQAQKFAGVEHAEAAAVIERIAEAGSPEEAARMGRGTERAQPLLLRPDWATAKLAVMYAGLRAKFTAHAGPRALLLATATEGPAGAPLELVEASPHDFFWGRGVDGSGTNHLGTLLMSIRDELLATQRVQHDRHSAEHLSTAEQREHTSSR
ncbi:Riboflavin biosynthesis protein RibD at N-terminal half [Coccomyxa sp. Obi]|nr:Riboflavin biosynthesis protein RibD at N-terminal half [Coccomyxa sp. Obi]